MQKSPRRSPVTIETTGRRFVTAAPERGARCTLVDLRSDPPPLPLLPPLDRSQSLTSSPESTWSGGRRTASRRSRSSWRLREPWRKTTVSAATCVRHRKRDKTVLICPPSVLLSGVILSSVISPDPNISPFMLVLDARSLEEVARASIPAPVHMDLHGHFIAAPV